MDWLVHALDCNVVLVDAGRACDCNYSREIPMPACLYCGSSRLPQVNGDGTVECRGCAGHTLAPFLPQTRMTR